MRRLPIGPVLTSLLLVIAGAVYWARDRGGRYTEPPAPRGTPDNPVRMVSWDLRGVMETAPSHSTSPSPASIAGALARVSPHLVALQGAPSDQYAEEIARGLGRDWRVAALRSPAGTGRVLAVLINPKLAILERRLVETGLPEEALVVTMIGPKDRFMRVICFSAPQGNLDLQNRYLQRVLSWARSQSEGVTILAGVLEHASAATSGKARLDASIRKALAEEYIVVLPADGKPDRAEAGGSAIFITRSRSRIQKSLDSTSVGIEGIAVDAIVTDIEVL